MDSALQWLQELEDVFDPPAARDYAQIARAVPRSDDGIPFRLDGISQNGRSSTGHTDVGKQVQSEQNTASAPKSRYLPRVLLGGCAMCGDEHCGVSQMLDGLAPPTFAKRHGAHVSRFNQKIAPQDRAFLRSLHSLQRLRPTTDGNSHLQIGARGRQKFASYLKWISYRHPKNRGTRIKKKKTHKKISGVCSRHRKRIRKPQASSH